MSPEEWERVRNIRFTALQDSPDAFGSTLEKEELYSEEDWMRRLERSDCATFIAFSDDGTALGLIVGAPYDTFAGLFAMWVAPESRGAGIGSKLIEAVINWAKEQKQPKILLDVADDNLSAIALYESKGFLPTGITGTLPPPREHIKEHQRELRL